MTRRPGWIDEGAGRDTPPDPRPFAEPPPGIAGFDAPLATTPPDPAGAVVAGPQPLRPRLVEIDDTGADGGRIDHGWSPDPVRAARTRRAGSLGWFAGGLATFGAGWVGVSAWDFLIDQFHRSEWLGIATASVFAAGIAIASRGLAIEIAGWRALSRVETLRAHLHGPEDRLAVARREALDWIGRLAPRFRDDALALRIAACTTMAELRATLADGIVGRLEAAAQRASRNGAIQGGALVAIVPSPMLEGVLVALRGAGLIREIGRLFGLRPGIVVTLSLLRRVTFAAAAVGGIDLLAQATTDLVLHRLPVLRHLAASIPGTSVAAIRLYRLGLVTARAVSPLAEPPPGSVDPAPRPPPA